MKANELMIGDWVKFKNSDLCHQVYAVQGKSAKIDKQYWHKADNLLPIPLTPEILEKNGFKREDWVGNKGRLVSDDGRLILQNDENFINSFNTWYMHIDNEDFETIASCELSYVHQLQHALRLSGIDKEIKF